MAFVKSGLDEREEEGTKILSVSGQKRSQIKAISNTVRKNNSQRTEAEGDPALALG